MFNSANTTFTLDLPDWAVNELNQLPSHLPTLEERMTGRDRNFAPLTATRPRPNAGGTVRHRRSLVIGVNRVLPFNCSADAEVMAISLAQNGSAPTILGAAGLPAHQIVVNWRPCAMCLGAVLWSACAPSSSPKTDPNSSRSRASTKAPPIPTGRKNSPAAASTPRTTSSAPKPSPPTKSSPPANPSSTTPAKAKNKRSAVSNLQPTRFLFSVISPSASLWETTTVRP